MSLVLNDYFMQNILSQKVTYVNGLSWYIGLFIAAHTPAATDTISFYTSNEATFTGYSRQLINTFSPSLTNPTTGVWQSACGYAIFSPSVAGAGQNVYGYFVTDSGGSNLYLAEAFASPPAPFLVGNTLIPFYVLPLLQETSIP